MPARCLRPLCSATVFSCCAAASLLDTYVELVPHRYCYTPREFVELDLEREAEVTLYPYSELGSARLRYFVVGAPSGGAAQLATILGAPLLPCNILTPVSRARPMDPDDVDSYVNEATPLARRLSKRIGSYADIVVHYDPIHDRDWVRSHLTIRLHLKRVPETYRRFIEAHASRDSVIVYVDVSHPWLQHRVDESVYLQIGGANGIEDWEYLERSPRLEPYLRQLGASRYPWRPAGLSNRDLAKLPESEWGSRPQLRKSVEELANELGLEIVELKLSSYYQACTLATTLYILAEEPFSGATIENYKMSTSTTFLKLRHAPLWSVFTTTKSLEEIDRALQSLAGETPLNKAIYATVPTGYREQGCRWPDSTTLKQWIETISKHTQKTIVIPKQVKQGETTRTLETMNKAYKEAWQLAANQKPHKPTIDTYTLHKLAKTIHI